MPAILYGTAWKEERTAELVRLALAAGFSGIDTANQRKHYFEAGVGDAVATPSGADGAVARAELFLQTKFTYARGQDHRLPYDPAAPFAEQVRQSLASSLEHLRHRLRRLVPAARAGARRRHHGVGSRGVARDGGAAREGRTRLIGVSNVSAAQLARCSPRRRSSPRSCRTAASRATAGIATYGRSVVATGSCTRASRC